MMHLAERAEYGITVLVLKMITPFVSIQDLGQLDTALSSAEIRESWLLEGLTNLCFTKPLRLSFPLQIHWFAERNACIDSKIHVKIGPGRIPSGQVVNLSVKLKLKVLEIAPYNIHERYFLMDRTLMVDEICRGFNDFDRQYPSALRPPALPLLHTLQLLDMDTITSDQFKVITRHCPNLVWLEIYLQCGDSIEHLKGCEYLRTLVLKLSHRESVNPGMRHLAAGCQKLICLSLAECLLDDLDLLALVEGCKLLVKVILYVCPYVTDVGIGHLVNACKTTLQFFRTSVRLTDKTLGHLATCPALRLVEFLTNGTAAEAGDLCENEVVNFAKACPNLQVFRCYNRNITNLGVQALTDNCPDLRSICLRNAPMVDESWAGDHCGGLLQFHLWHSPITDEGVRHIVAKCPNLRFVLLVGCNNITNFSLELLESLQLEYLNIRRCTNISVLHPRIDFLHDSIEPYIPIFPHFL